MATKGRQWLPPDVPPGTIKLGKHGNYFVGCPIMGSRRKKWINLHTKDRRAAIELVQATGVERLVHLALARHLTAEAIAAVTATTPADVGDLVESWIADLCHTHADSSIDSYSGFVKRFLGEMGQAGVSLPQVTERHVRDFIANGVRGPLRLEGQGGRCKALKSFFSFAHERGAIGRNICHRLKPDRRNMSVEQLEPQHHRPVSEADYQRLIAAARRPYSDLYVLSYCTGLRVSDCCKLEWASLSPEGLIIYPHKSGRSKRLFLPFSDPLINRPELSELVTRLLQTPETMREKWVWPDLAEWFEASAYQRVKYYTKTLFTKHGLPHLTFHSFRVAFARRLEAAGKTIWDVARVMGHSSTDTTAIYLGRPKVHWSAKGQSPRRTEDPPPIETDSTGLTGASTSVTVVVGQSQGAMAQSSP